jgi:glycosyltransferase involved in cell wall biosynthesis
METICQQGFSDLNRATPMPLTKRTTALISVIIPTYNYGHLITATIQSVLSQQDCSTEIIIVDDGSTDNTCDIIKPYLSNNVKYIQIYKSGVSSARNRGIEESNGDYIIFLDADDILGKGSLYSRLKVLENDKSFNFCVCRNKHFFGVGKLSKISYSQGWPLYKRHLDVHICYANLAPPLAFLFRSDKVKENGMFDASLTMCEDYDFILEFLMRNGEPGYDPKGMVYYRRHATNATQRLRELYSYDCIMHDRIRKALGGETEFAMNKREEKYLAYFCNTLNTALNMQSIESTPPNNLIKNSFWALDQLGAINGYENHSILIHLYYMKSLLLMRSIGRKDQRYCLLEKRFKDIARNFSIPDHDLSIAKQSFGFLKDRNADLLEGYRMLKFTFQLLTKRPGIPATLKYRSSE